MRNTSIAKQIKFVKWFLRWVIEKGITKTWLMINSRLKWRVHPKKVIFLTQNEINKLRTCPIPPTKKYLERVRDVSLFCCFTGITSPPMCIIWNVVMLKRSYRSYYHKDGRQSYYWIKWPQQGNTEKYKGVPFPNDKALPVVSNQRMNEFFKRTGTTGRNRWTNTRNIL